MTKTSSEREEIAVTLVAAGASYAAAAAAAGVKKQNVQHILKRHGFKLSPDEVKRRRGASARAVADRYRREMAIIEAMESRP